MLFSRRPETNADFAKLFWKDNTHTHVVFGYTDTDRYPPPHFRDTILPSTLPINNYKTEPWKLFVYYSPISFLPQSAELFFPLWPVHTGKRFFLQRNFFLCLFGGGKIRRDGNKQQSQLFYQTARTYLSLTFSQLSFVSGNEQQTKQTKKKTNNKSFRMMMV